MKIHAIRQPLPVLGVLAFLSVSCDRPEPTGVATEAEGTGVGAVAIGQRTVFPGSAEDRREILDRYRDELWPCPEDYEPILIQEYVVAPSPPLKFPGDPEYWEECPAMPGYASNHNSSSGTAGHLGSFTNEWDSCLDFNTYTGFFDASLTAASGEVLNWQITAKATPIPGGGLYSETTDVTFDGGTGRFANARGYAAGAGRGIPGAGEYYYYVGCLAY